MEAGTPGTFPASGWPSYKAWGSYGPRADNGSESIQSSHSFVQRGGTAPTHILAISPYFPLGKVSSCHLPW